MSIKRFLRQALKPYRWWLLLYFIGASAFTFLRMYDPYTNKIFIDALTLTTREQAFHILFWPIVARLLVALAWFAIRRFMDICWFKLRAGLQYTLAQKSMQHMMGHSHAFYQNMPAGSLQSRIKNVAESMPEFIKVCIGNFWAIALQLIITLLAYYYIYPTMLPITTIWLVVFVSIHYFMYAKMKALHYNVATRVSTVSGHLGDVMGNMSLVRLTGNTNKEYGLLSDHLATLRKAHFREGWFTFTQDMLQGLCYLAYQTACFYILVQDFSQGNASVGDFVFVLQTNVFLVMNLWSLSENAERAFQSGSRIKEGLDTILLAHEIVDIPDAKPLVLKKGTFALENISFSYPGKKSIFQNLSLTLQAGQKIGLVGYAGSGKTTFMNLLLRIFNLQAGRILLDGQDISKMQQQSLREYIAVIAQEPVLFHRSIGANIGYGVPDTSKEAIVAVAKKAGAHDFIQALPKGYHTFVGERGTKLSGGQRQCIAIARAMLQNMPILFLDEATSSLDNITERHIQKSLGKLMHASSTRLTLVIAHRLTTLLDMDRILVFEKGKIVQDGSHHVLIKEQGLYQDLWKGQRSYVG